MKTTSRVRAAIGLLAAGAGVAAGAYAVLVGVAWHRFGRRRHANADEVDVLLDRFMPVYDVVERHHVQIAAPAAITLTAAKEQDLLHLPLVRAIFKAREIVLSAAADTRPQPRGLLAQVQALGWGILADEPGREIVVGSVTKPWESNPIFRALPPGEFAKFCDPGYVKIAWTLRADAVGERVSVFRTETRAVATDAIARDRFRRYWAFASPGIATIRWLSLQPLKRETERRTRAAESAQRDRGVPSNAPSSHDLASGGDRRWYELSREYVHRAHGR
jgi:hypothetical protein